MPSREPAGGESREALSGQPALVRVVTDFCERCLGAKEVATRNIAGQVVVTSCPECLSHE